MVHSLITVIEYVSSIPDALMNYNNYDTKVVQKYRVKIIGWTHNKLISPFNIHTVDELRTLRDALRCGACYWARMTKAELTRHSKEMEMRESAGEVVVVKRKERSDKGKKKGPRAKLGADEEGGSEDLDTDVDQNGAGPSKRRKVAASTATPAAKSKATKKKAAGKSKTAKGKGRDTGKTVGPVQTQLPPSHGFNSVVNASSDSGGEGL